MLRLFKHTIWVLSMMWFLCEASADPGHDDLERADSINLVNGRIYEYQFRAGPTSEKRARAEQCYIAFADNNIGDELLPYLYWRIARMYCRSTGGDRDETVSSLKRARHYYTLAEATYPAKYYGKLLIDIRVGGAQLAAEREQRQESLENVYEWLTRIKSISEADLWLSTDERAKVTKDPEQLIRLLEKVRSEAVAAKEIVAVNVVAAVRSARSPSVMVDLAFLRDRYKGDVIEVIANEALAVVSRNAIIQMAFEQMRDDWPAPRDYAFNKQASKAVYDLTDERGSGNSEGNGPMGKGVGIWFALLTCIVMGLALAKLRRRRHAVDAG